MKRLESYQAARYRRQRFLKYLRWFVLVLVVYEVLTIYAAKAVVVRSTAMEPTLRPGDHLVLFPSAYSFNTVITEDQFAYRTPQRGDLVLVRLPSAKERGWLERAAWSIIDFFTLNKLPSTLRFSSEAVIKRVVALPGDSLFMENFVIKVRQQGSEHYLTEYELSGRSYDINTQGLPEGWHSGLPLSGFFDERLLGPDEYYVVGDNRLSYSDSRLFGPVSSKAFLGKLGFRYWPFNKRTLE
jgi:signal peptidase I